MCWKLVYYPNSGWEMFISCSSPCDRSAHTICAVTRGLKGIRICSTANLFKQLLHDLWFIFMKCGPTKMLERNLKLGEAGSE